MTRVAAAVVLLAVVAIAVATWMVWPVAEDGDLPVVANRERDDAHHERDDVHLKQPRADDEEPAAASPRRDGVSDETADDEEPAAASPRRDGVSDETAEHNITEYEKYTPQELRLGKGRGRARDLVGYMVDPMQDFTVRKRAQEALFKGGVFRGDPDLSLKLEGPGPPTPRSDFSARYLLPNLKHDNKQSRALTNDLLMKLWRVRNVPRINRFDGEDSLTWEPAIAAWTKLLKRR